MLKLKAAVKKHYSKGYDSDSTGYCSSASDRPISRSQFILRPSTALTQYSFQTPTSPYGNLPKCPHRRKTATMWDYPDSPCTSSFSEEDAVGKIIEEAEENSTITVRSPAPILEAKTPVNSPFPFDEDDEDLGCLFDQLELKEEPPPEEIVEEIVSTLTRKKLLIKEPDESSKIYFSPEKLKKTRALPKKGSMPRSILKKEPSLMHMHIYEEIEDDHLNPLPGDVRPKLPERPKVHPIRIFPPCKAFQPKRLLFPRYPSSKRRKKMPSLHRSASAVTKS